MHMMLPHRATDSLRNLPLDEDEVERIKKYGTIADALHTDLHECVGHASGKLADGTDPNALKNYASPLEEARADLFALYYMMDKKITELGLLPDEEAAKAAYDSYLRNGLLTQIVRIQPGKDIEQAHMRCRSAISHWVYEKGKNENVVEFVAKMTEKPMLRSMIIKKSECYFGELLKEIQRIKSEGDFEAGKKLLKISELRLILPCILKFSDRYAKLNLAPYTGFVNPTMIPVYDSNGKIADVSMNILMITLDR